MTTFLDKLVAASREEVAKRKAEVPLGRLIEMIEQQRPAADFIAAIKGPSINLIAEIKRASPSKGDLNTALDAPALAREYREAGASAISVLTEPRFFKGSLADLAAVAAVVDIPVLRKDFILEDYQVYEARAYGASAVLLIAAILTDEQLAHLLEVTRALGMAALVEVHDENELDRVVATLSRERDADEIGKSVGVGINNRNLYDFTVDLGTTIKLSARLMADRGTVISTKRRVAVVSESGVRTREDVLKLSAASVDALLVGEALVTETEPKERIRYLLGW